MKLTEKQKNCPYCHGMKRMQDRLIYGTRRDILALKDNSLEYTLVFPVHHQLPELAQTHDHRVSDAIQLPHLLSSPSPPAFSLS